MAATLASYGVTHDAVTKMSEQTIIVEHLTTDSNTSILAVATTRINESAQRSGKSSTLVSSSYSYAGVTVAGVAKRLSMFKYSRASIYI